MESLSLLRWHGHFKVAGEKVNQWVDQNFKTPAVDTCIDISIPKIDNVDEIKSFLQIEQHTLKMWTIEQHILDTNAGKQQPYAATDV